MINLSRFLSLSTLLIVFATPAFAQQSSFAYRWEDDRKAVHITSRIDLVPAKYREKASRLEMINITSQGGSPVGDPGTVDGTRDISFDNSKPGVIVPAMINQKVRRNVIIDTGSAWVVITSKFARALGFDIQKLGTGHFRVFGKIIDAKVALLGSLRVGSAVAKNVSAAIIDFEGRGETSAIIGMNFLSRFVFEIDHENGKTTFLQDE